MEEKLYTASELIANSLKNSPSLKAILCAQVMTIDDGIDVTLPDICFTEKQLDFINSGHSRADRIRILISHRNLLADIHEIKDNPKKHLLYEKAFELGYDGIGVSGIQPYYEMLIDLIK